MNKKKIEEMLELMEKYGLSEINIEEEGVKVHLRKGGQNVETLIQPGMPQIMAAAKQENVPETKEEAKNFIEIKAPMVGTFYAAPAPDAQPYVSVGQSINEGDVLCILEAMKLMNEIKSEVKGKIADILVENGYPVEFGQVLFLVEPK